MRSTTTSTYPSIKCPKCRAMPRKPCFGSQGRMRGVWYGPGTTRHVHAARLKYIQIEGVH